MSCAQKIFDLSTSDYQPWAVEQLLGGDTESNLLVSRNPTSMQVDAGSHNANAWLLHQPGDLAARQCLTLETVGITHPSSQRTLLRRGAHKACPLTSVVLGQIISYPKMILDGDQLPPFIQAPCHIEEELAQDCAELGRHRCLPKSLVICASLVRMFHERTSSNSGYVWATIYAEVEHLQKEVSTISLKQSNRFLEGASDRQLVSPLQSPR